MEPDGVVVGLDSGGGATGASVTLGTGTRVGCSSGDNEGGDTGGKSD